MLGIKGFFKKFGKKDDEDASTKDAAKERLHLVLMQDRANVSVDFLEMMKQEIIDVIKKYVDVDEAEIDVRLTNQINDDGTNGAPALYANIPITGIKNEKINSKIKNKSEQTEVKKVINKNVIEENGNDNKKENKEVKRTISDGEILKSSNTGTVKKTTTKKVASKTKNEDKTTTNSKDNNENKTEESNNQENKTTGETTDSCMNKCETQECKDECKQDTKTTSNVLDDIIYPLYVPEDTYLHSKDTVSTDNGNRVILTFAGTDPFILVEEKSTMNEDMEIIPVNGEPLLIGNTIGAIGDNSVYWTSNGVDFYLTSNTLNSNEMMTIAESITNGTSLVANTK